MKNPHPSEAVARSLSEFHEICIYQVVDGCIKFDCLVVSTNPLLGVIRKSKGIQGVDKYYGQSVLQGRASSRSELIKYVTHHFPHLFAIFEDIGYERLKIEYIPPAVGPVFEKIVSHLESERQLLQTTISSLRAQKPEMKMPSVALCELSNQQLELFITQGGVSFAQLPCSIDESDFNCVRNAVLSWRWDLQDDKNRSLNLLRALICAKELGFHRLFIDKISIPPAESEELFTKNILKFTNLMHTIPVIASYGDAFHWQWKEIMSRPWISSEVRLMRLNATQVIHVARLHDIPNDLNNATRNQFLDAARFIWSSNLSMSALMVLLGRSDIGRLVDFADICPEFRVAFLHAFKCLRRSDFLLFVFLLLFSTSRTDRMQLSFGPGAVYDIEYEFFKFELVTITSLKKHWNLTLGGVLIGVWQEDYAGNISSVRYKLMLVENAAMLLMILVSMEKTDVLQICSSLPSTLNMQIDTEVTKEIIVEKFRPPL